MPHMTCVAGSILFLKEKKAWIMVVWQGRISIFLICSYRHRFCYTFMWLNNLGKV